MTKREGLKVPKDFKLCLVCGRKMEFRKSWAKNWDAVKYCSDRCRRNKKSPDDSLKILEALRARAPGLSICPSDILPAEEKQNHEIMERVRSSARKLADAGLIEITQKGQVVDPYDFKGPIRLRLKR